MFLSENNSHFVA